MSKSNGSTRIRVPWVQEKSVSCGVQWASGVGAGLQDGYARGCTPEEAIAEALRCRHCGDGRAACVANCPIGIDIPAFVAHVATGNFGAAHEVFTRTSPMPAVCGRVCREERHCRVQCLACSEGDPVSVAKLERFVGDWYLQRFESADTHRISAGDPKVAVIGSGPAGLSCAADLARAGYNVTVFEALDEAGGRIARGLSESQLPRKIVESEVKGVRDLGVTFRFKSVIGKTVTVQDLLGRLGYRAVFIGAGDGSPLSLDIPGTDLCGVYHAPEFLNHLNLLESYLSRDGRNRLLPLSHVVVVGGGDSALECARTARRLGAEEVTVLCRRSLQDLKARKDEVEAAHREGIQFLYLAAPLRLLGDEEKYLRRVECLEMDWSEEDAAGKPFPRPRPGMQFQLPAEICVIAVGRRPSPILASLIPDIEVNEMGRVVVDPKTHQTNLPGVFAGGNITRDLSVTAAMGDGQEAARGIHEFLSQSKQA